MVAVCLMERVPFSPIDSSTLLRKLENDQTLTEPEKASVLRTVDSGAVQTALRSMADDNGGVELEEFEVSGNSRVMVMGIDRTRLLKELPESMQMESGSNGNKGVVVGQFPRPDMWMGPPPPPGPMRGGGPRMMMMMMMGWGEYAAEASSA